MPCHLRYHVKRSFINGGNYYVLDTRGPRMVATPMFGGSVMYYNTHSAAQTVADSLNKEDMMHDYDPTPARPLRGPFWIFRRNGATNLGYMPQGSPPSHWAITRVGAENALAAFLETHGSQPGEYLVQHPQGAWTFTVKPPEPAPLVIEAV